MSDWKPLYTMPENEKVFVGRRSKDKKRWISKLVNSRSELSKYHDWTHWQEFPLKTTGRS